VKASIVRLEQSEQGALGALLFDGVIFCFTLQPDVLDKERFHGIKYPNTFEVVGEGTKGHSALLFHAGNVETDSLGCTLLGSSVMKLKGFRAISNSGLTFKLFLDYTKNVDEFPLLIIDCYT
jgi:hypothetical protein